MSVDAGLTIKLRAPKAFAEIARVLVTSAWGKKVDESADVLPVGGDTFDWEHRRGATLEELVALVGAKQAAGEVAGLRLWWQATEHGADFLLFDDGTLVVSPIERVTLDDRISDASWYVSRLIPLLRDRGIVVESWSWTDA